MDEKDIDERLAATVTKMADAVAGRELWLSIVELRTFWSLAKSTCKKEVIEKARECLVMYYTHKNQKTGVIDDKEFWLMSEVYRSEGVEA